MKQRLEIIDFLRGFSIFTIVLMHLLQSYPINPLFMRLPLLEGREYIYLFYVVGLGFVYHI